MNNQQRLEREKAIQELLELSKSMAGTLKDFECEDVRYYQDTLSLLKERINIK